MTDGAYQRVSKDCERFFKINAVIGTVGFGLFSHPTQTQYSFCIDDITTAPRPSGVALGPSSLCRFTGGAGSTQQA